MLQCQPDIEGNGHEPQYNIQHYAERYLYGKAAESAGGCAAEYDFFLQGNLGKCAEVLMEIVQDEEASPQTRINAAQIAMTQTKNWTETIDIINRIAVLEAAMEKEKGE